MTDMPSSSPMDSNRSSTDSVRREYDWAAVEPSTAVVETVAVTGGTDPGDMPPLYSSIDSDALDSLFVPNAGSRSTGAAEVSFSYAGHDVLVRTDGVVVVSTPATSGGR